MSSSIKESQYLIFTCEHGGNQVPQQYQYLFNGKEDVLNSHRGIDHGALDLSRYLSESFNAELVFSETTRLLVEANRSKINPDLFSEFSRHLDMSAKQDLLTKFYEPYRKSVETKVAANYHQGKQVLHISLHTFTPELDGEVRDADIGLLFDSGRTSERRLATAIKKALVKELPDMRVRFNYPYKGTADGLTTSLRKIFEGSGYAGLEIEVNQKHPLQNSESWLRIKKALRSAIAQAL